MGHVLKALHVETKSTRFFEIWICAKYLSFMDVARNSLHTPFIPSDDWNGQFKFGRDPTSHY